MNQYKQIFLSRNRNKKRYCIWTYEAMWDCAEMLSHKLWGHLPGRHGASTVINVALAEYLIKHGIEAPRKIKKIKAKEVCLSYNQ